MLKTAKVILWGTIVGYFYYDGVKGFIVFEYDKDFLTSGIELSPIKMSLSQKIYEFPELGNTSFRGVPGLLSDSLPDKFGNAIIDNWLSLQGRTTDSFNVLERLCYTGERGMGALEYEPDNSGEIDKDERISIQRMTEFASSILSRQKLEILTDKDAKSYKQLVKLGTSAGGARAKAVVAFNKTTNEFRSGQIELSQDFEHWLIKFDGVTKNGDHNLEDKIKYTLIEYAYYQMAIHAGIHMSECMLFRDGDYMHFMTKRFDRENGEKIHMQSLGALLHIDYNIPGLCSYEQAAITARKIGCPSLDIEQLYRRMVFNVLAINQDDHVKNISFLMDRKGKWTLSPAYDMTFAYNLDNRWLKTHQMTINGKMNDLTKEDLMSSGKIMDISRFKCSRIISEVYEAVKGFKDIAASVGVNSKIIDFISNIQHERHTYFFSSI